MSRRIDPTPQSISYITSRPSARGVERNRRLPGHRPSGTSLGLALAWDGLGVHRDELRLGIVDPKIEAFLFVVGRDATQMNLSHGIRA
jgi:hypothetical protein